MTLLIYKTNESHISFKVVERAREADVQLLTISIYCSNTLQPLDIYVFKPFKAYYNTTCNKYMLQHPRIPMFINDSVGGTAEALQKYFTPSIIVAGFRKSGIHPFVSRCCFKDADFLILFVTYPEN